MLFGHKAFLVGIFLLQQLLGSNPEATAKDGAKFRLGVVSCYVAHVDKQNSPCKIKEYTIKPYPKKTLRKPSWKRQNSRDLTELPGLGV